MAGDVASGVAVGVLTHPVPDDLADRFSNIYRLDVSVPDGGRITDILQPEWANLRFFSEKSATAELEGPEPSIESCFVSSGPLAKPIRFSMGTTRMWGVALLPLGWAMHVGTQASALADTMVDGESHEAFRHFVPLGEAIRAQCGDAKREFAAMLDWLRADAREVRDADRIRRVQEVMGDPYLVQVGEFAEAAGLNPRTLERLCRRHFGFSPAVLLRRQRLIRTVTAFMAAGEGSWTEVIDRHYHDHSHFVREFHNFMGMSPTAYAKMDHPILSAFVDRRRDIWGDPVKREGR